MSKTVSLPAGEAVPALGLGTWRLGENARRKNDEVAAIRLALELGFRLIDTAEMYGEGGAEQVIGDAIAGRRHEVFIVSKVYPHNASRRGAIGACERSLQRLGTDCIDLYLLHWRGAHPLAETVEAFEALKAGGKIRHWGVSNFDTDDMEELWATPGGRACAVNQVYYSVANRGIEFDLIPWQRERGVPLMAYSPVDQGALAGDKALAAIGARHGATAAQVALAWVLAQPGVIALPKAVQAAHLRENWAAGAITLTPEDLAEIDRRHPPPKRKRPLAVI